MIYCVWYPSGGFGHFINAVLSLHGKNFVRPTQRTIKFSANGNAHALELVAPKYQRNYRNYKFEFDPGRNYSVLIDNGIDNESTEFREDFADSRVIKLCYSNKTWPIIARTMIEKAMNSSLEQQVPVDFDLDDPTQPWAVREKYFLFLRDHAFAQCWKPMDTTQNLMIDQLLDYQTLKQQLTDMGVELEDFRELWQQWWQANQVYIDPVTASAQVIKCLKHNQSRLLDDFDSVWAQAVLYYFIFLEFGREVPHNDYADFFSSTDHIQEWLRS
jgi:hypothetical protein